MEIVMLFLIIATGAIVSVVVYEYLIKPNTSNKGGKVNVGYNRPARSFILDNSKYNFGWGVVIASEQLTPFKSAFTIETKDTTLNIPYYQWEIDYLDKFDSIAGNGTQTFIVKASNVDLDAEKNKQELSELREELARKTERIDYENSRKIEYKYEAERKTDERASMVLDMEKSKKKAEAGLRQQ